MGSGDWKVNEESFRKISEWLVAFRKAGYDLGRIESISDRELNSLEKTYLSMDLDFLEKMQVRIVRDGDENYPSKFTRFLESKHPRMLFCMGEVSLFNQPSILVCGARTASGAGLELAYKCGRLIAETGCCVVSGYARGVDLSAHLGALEAGGGTIAMIPYGLSRFSVRRGLMDVFDPDHFMVVSELPPSCGFMVKIALRRNKLLVAFADAVIVVEPGESGGTWYTAEKAILMQKPLFFHEGSRPEFIERMESMGAKRLTIRNGAPQLDEVYKSCRD